MSSEIDNKTLFIAEADNPYKGLHAFQSSDAQDFFGRENLTGKLVKRLGNRGSWLASWPWSAQAAVVNPAWSRPGLIPALWRGELPGSDRWFIVEMLPGSRPLDELEVALIRVAANQGANLREQLGRDAEWTAARGPVNLAR